MTGRISNAQLISLYKHLTDPSLLTDEKRFRSTVTTFVEEISTSSGTPTQLNCDDEAAMFPKTLLSFLKAYGCARPELVECSPENCFSDSGSRLVLLKYLIPEVAAVRSRKKHKVHMKSEEASIYKKRLLHHFTEACNALSLDQPPEGISVFKMLEVIKRSVCERLKKVPTGQMGDSIVPPGGLSPKQWAQVSRLIALLQQEYSCRRGTLLKRLDVTVQSFKWSERAKAQLDAIQAMYSPLRQQMEEEEPTGVAELLAARDNPLLCIERTSGKSRRQFTACELNKVLIGQVPDRGGRAWELEPPPPEMPAFMQRQTGVGRGEYRGHRGRGRGQGHRDARQAPVQASGQGQDGGFMFRDDPVNQGRGGRFTFNKRGRSGRGRGRY